MSKFKGVKILDTNTKFTMGKRYLSVSRDVINSNQKNIIVDGIEFNVSQIALNVTYNEHKDFVRLDKKAYSRCVV